jgi:hypothetical protein
MRYVYENETVNVKMTNATVEYAYEYLGSAPRLVVTPLTERCCIYLFIFIPNHIRCNFNECTTNVFGRST